MTWQAPVTDWESTDGVTEDDMNRIEGNIDDLDDRLTTLDSAYDAHVATTGATTVHATGTEARAATDLPLYLECRTSDPTGAELVTGKIWLRTDL